MSVKDERTLERLGEQQLLRGDRIVEIYAGEMSSPRRYTVTRMVERVEGWYVVTETYRGRERALHWHGDQWHENPTGGVLEVDEKNATTRRIGS